MLRQADPLLDDLHAFGFEQAFLERSVGLTNQDSAAAANDAVPGNASPRRCRGHGAARGTSSSAQTQGSCKPSVG